MFRKNTTSVQAVSSAICHSPGKKYLRLIVLAGASLFLLACLAVLYAICVEPKWLVERRLVLNDSPTLRVVHITDLHYRGSRRYLERVVERVNRLDADVVCVTGDIVEELPYLDEALQILGNIEKPMYGVRGNHDCWGNAAVEKFRECFRSTGGRWLLDQRVLTYDSRVEVTGSTGRLEAFPRISDNTALVHLLLIHDPSIVDRITDMRFDLILAGHTHGGQLRIPGGRRPLFDLAFVDKYDRGLYRTKAGPLYVNPGIGTYGLAVRFSCRPEITVIDL